MLQPINLQAQIKARGLIMEEAYARIIDSHGKQEGARLIRRALKSTFDGMIAQAKARTPSRTGKLRRKITVKPSQRRGFIYGARFGFFGFRPWPVPLGVEFGSKTHRERAPLRTAWRAREPNLISHTGDAIDKSIQEEARKADRRAAVRMARARR